MIIGESSISNPSSGMDEREIASDTITIPSENNSKIASLSTLSTSSSLKPISRIIHHNNHQTAQENNQQEQEQTQSLPSGLHITTTTSIETNNTSTTNTNSHNRSSSSSTISTNVFTKFPSSCCCQMTTKQTIGNNNCKKSLKNISNSSGDARFAGGPSPLRQLLPIALCLLSFATVFSILIVYMDTTEIRHQQFRLNMSRDYELHGIPQDDPTLIAFLRQIHMKRYPTSNFLKDAPIEHLNFTEHHELTPEMAHYIANLVDNKLNGAFLQSMTGLTSNFMTAPWLAETLNWNGLIVEPEPRRFFSLRKQNVHRPKVQVVHACLSSSGYPKEVRIHNEDSDVRINSLFDEETSWFNSRVKCFPLYTLMLAINRVNYDLLSLGCPNQELDILQTLPFNKVNIEVISIHLTDNHENLSDYIRNISKFLAGKSYMLKKKFEHNYIYKKIRTNKQVRAFSSSSSSSSSLSSLSSTTTTTTLKPTFTTMIAKMKMQKQLKKDDEINHNNAVNNT